MAFFYRPRHAEPSGSARTARRMLAIVPILVVTLVVYAVAVFAWYQAGVVNTGNTIRTGSFAAQVEITDASGQQTLWSSAESEPNGILGCGEAITLASSGEMRITVSNLATSTLSFQYRVALVAGDSALALTATGNADKVLEPKEAETYSFTLPENTQQVTLELRTAFTGNDLPEIEVQQAPDTQQADGISNALPAAPAEESSDTVQPSAPYTTQQSESREPDAVVSQAPIVSEPAASSAPAVSSAPSVSSAPDVSSTASQTASEESSVEAVESEAQESTDVSLESQSSAPEEDPDA